MSTIHVAESDLSSALPTGNIGEPHDKEQCEVGRGGRGGVNGRNLL